MQSKNMQELLKAFTIAAKDEELLHAFLEDLLTPKELKTLPKRWYIVRQLAKGEKQRDLAGELNIGIATITRGARELRDKNGGFAQVLRKMKK